ncbi:unnamed protein product [Penicillium nalgiovense]|uniref:Uncharacterized protein n=1 Tax=Penicillium nalgiovense TaxID=60175 RepID=A0A9W4HRI8_PENNA|nr:unnamed protein product [Penicillium nalgiovense]CAG8061897.1 unnamed protein product [Penicillium nalgiovense]CAG8065039.1 unnamed protein product [Penicillium nalgiovense]CAG8066041.1 unnamed protein product [Penicillium nalgiovense]CAG8067896.1 unnamed protein product [Penicillium nalgiovense]
MTTDSYPDERDFQPHVLEPGDQDSQYAPTPGYYGRTPASSCGLSPSPDYHSEHDLEDLCQHEPERPRLLQLSEWHDGMLSDELPANCIQYTIEWKVTMNKKVLSRDTEEDVVLTPSAYWPKTLKGKLERLLEGKIPRKGRVRSDDTSIAVSVNDRSQRDLMKRFDHLEIDWTAVEKQLLKWGELFRRGKKLRLSITFKYVEDDSLHKIISGRVEKRGRSSVTKRMLNERDAQLDAEENVSGQESIWRGVYNLMRCPSSSCHLGPHCWQDPHGKKHYKLRSHQLKRLIAFVEKGGALLSHEDVPNNFREELYMEERHRLESQQSQKNKTVGTPGSCQPININFNGMQSSPQQDTSNPTTASAMVLPPNDQVMEDLNLTGLRDEAVKDYGAWHESNVGDENLKAQFRQACNVALANGLDLRLIHEDQDPSFFIDKGIVVGIARQFVRDIGQWVKCVRNVTPDDQATQAAA